MLSTGLGYIWRPPSRAIWRLDRAAIWIRRGCRE